jgi:hypothetical protein
MNRGVNQHCHDFGFLALEIVDSNGYLVRSANDSTAFSIDGPGETVATDNGFEAEKRVQRARIGYCEGEERGNWVCNSHSDGKRFREIGSVTVSTKQALFAKFR